MRLDDALPVMAASGLPVFAVGDLVTMFPGRSRGSVVRSLERWQAKGRVARLKNGVYELLYPRDRGVPDIVIANRIYPPSYVSLETALSIHGLIPEFAHAVTSVTPKPTRRFRNRHGLFIYRTLRPPLFAGYELREEGGWRALVATPEKALADYLYLRNYRRKDMDLSGERIDWKLVRKLDRAAIARWFRAFGLRMGALDAFL